MVPYFTINHDKKTMEIRIIYLTDDNIKMIKQALDSCTVPYTISINIEVKDFGDHLKSICKLIDHCSPIHLRITDILLDVDNLNAIGDVLSNRNYLIKNLTLRSNRIDNVSFSLLYRALIQSHYMEHLSIAMNRINGTSLTQLLTSVKSLNALKVLELDNNYINAKDCEALIQTLKDMEHLEALSLVDNPIGDNGAIAISNHINDFKSIHTLNIASCSIGHIGTTQLAKNLIRNKTVSVLGISVNDIGTEGLFAISNLINSNPLLSTLNLTLHAFKAPHLMHFYRTLVNSNTLKSVLLYPNRKTKKSLKTVIKRYPDKPRSIDHDIQSKEDKLSLDILCTHLQNLLSIKQNEESEDNHVFEDEFHLRAIGYEKKLYRDVTCSSKIKPHYFVNTSVPQVALLPSSIKDNISKLTWVGDHNSPQSSAVITLNAVSYLSRIKRSVETREAHRSAEKLKLG